MSLEKQTYRNFELIIVDALHPQKREWIEEREWSFPIKYVGVHPNHRFWLDRGRWNVCGQLNTAILHAEGELLARLDDCSEFDGNYLQRCWKGYGEGYFPLAMHIRYLEGKPAKVNREYMEKGYEANYSQTLEKDSRAQLLKRMYGEEGLVRDTRFPAVEKHGGRMLAYVGWYYGYSTVSLQAALKINGFDENFDGDKCFPPGHLVYGEETKTIEEVNVGDLVLTHRGRLRRVTKLHRRWYEGDLITFDICGGVSVSVTPGHLLLVSMPVPRGKKNSLGFELTLSSTGFIKARQLAEAFLQNNKYAHQRRKYRLIFSAPKTQTWTEHIEVGEHRLKLTEDLARLMGYYVADGSGGRYLEFCFNKDELDYAHDVLNICNNELSFLRFRLPDEKQGSISHDGNSITVNFHVGEEFCNNWKKLLGHNAHTKRIPFNILYNYNLRICEEFKKGAWRGDGDKDKRRYVSVSTQLIHQMQMLLGRLGVYSRINGFIQRNGYGKGKHIYHLTIMDPPKRKHVKKTGHITLSNGEEIRGVFFYRPIRDVKINQYKGWVYHLEVEEDRTYHVNAVAVHNSQEDQDFGLRLRMAGYRNFLLDTGHMVIEHEHKPIPQEVITRDVKPIKCNYTLYQLNKRKRRFRANVDDLNEDDYQYVREESLKPPCSPRPNFYQDDCEGELFQTWKERRPQFNLREERLEI